MIYYVDGCGKLPHKSYACVSDHKTHETITVYNFLKHFYEHNVSNEFPFLHKIFYFGDGSAAQYKNFKNLTNLILHQNDFHIQAEWNFFATSHGTNAYNGVGSTIKRLLAHASLQHPFSNQILTPKQLFDFAEANVDGITSFLVSSGEVVSNTEFLVSQFATSSTFKGTQSHHQFIPNASSLCPKMKKRSFATHSKEFRLAEGGSSKVQMMND